MPRVNKVDKCRKSPGQCGKCSSKIKVGDPYVWWKFRFGGKFVRCAKPECAPKASDLTQSEYLSQIYDLQERTFEAESFEDLETQVSEVKDEIENIKSECEDKLNNMPDSLQSSPTGEMIQERIDNLDSAISELDNVNFCFEGEEPDKEKFKDEAEFKKATEEYQKELQEQIDQAAEEAVSALGNLG